MSSLSDNTGSEEFNSPSWRTLIRCPIFHECDDTVEIGEIEAHCRRKHPNYLFDDPFFFPRMTFGANVVVLIENNIPYLAYYFVYRDEVRFAVFCLNPHVTLPKKVINIKLYNGKSILVINDDYPVVPFDEKRHCSRCMFGSNQHACHTNVAIDQLHLINKQGATELLRNDYYSCHLEFKPSISTPIEDINNNMIQYVFTCEMCFLLYQSPYTISMCRGGHTICEQCRKNTKCFCGNAFHDKLENRFVKELAECYFVQGRRDWDTMIREGLKCPICYKLMHEIVLCPLGHPVCGSCKATLQLRHRNCYYCDNEYPIQDIHNDLAETVASQYSMRCENKDCSFEDSIKFLYTHENYCRFNV